VERRVSGFRTDSFRVRIFSAILLVALVPAAVAVAGGTLTLRGVGQGSGTLGAWDSVAESGRELLESLEAADVDDPAVLAAAESHRRTLSESVRWSRTYAFIAGRFVRTLPIVALLATLLVAGLALFTADRLSRAFAAPVAELVAWTDRIARAEPLPEPEAGEDGAVRELRALRDALREMAGQIEEGRRRAVEAARMRSWTDFARRAAHDIKNPLTPMKIAAVTLAKGADERSAVAGRILLEEIDRLDAMARTFAQYGKPPEGPRSDVDLVELMGSLAGVHAGVRVTADGDAPALVHGHLDALRRVFENLIRNAIEAEGEAAQPSVEVRVGRTRLSVEVEVSDRGPGIPEELLDDIWSPDVTTKQGGSGLGLAIVRQLVDAHGGAVTASNRAGGGATVRVTFPAVEASA
jgi:signal transduction histidine kinase